MKLLHVDTSPKSERSNSRALGRYFIEKLALRMPSLTVDHLDLVTDPAPAMTEAFTIASYTPAADRTVEMQHALVASDALCARMLDADALLFAMPMYNWSMPAAFKAFIDAVVRAGITYVATADGRYVGALGTKKILFLTTRGGDLRPGSPLAGMDALTPALRAAFEFMGAVEPCFIDAQPVQFAQPDDRAAALGRARAELNRVADAWSGHFGSATA
ncbi:FMN-dependent NADH-azoreductase [Sphingomonas sp. R86520]|uniref:FMN-dependent NADH-azoreductase n=1 Tax=Sphingomonas sp. R86520 TaxID=3093859 RepID=UPI0036D36582